MKVEYTYTGPQNSEMGQHMKTCNLKGPLMVHICKLFPKADCSSFDAFGRVLSGTVKPGDRVRILGETYTPEDEEDSTLATVSNVWVYQARYRIPVSKAAAGGSLAEAMFPCLREWESMMAWHSAAQAPSSEHLHHPARELRAAGGH